MLAVDTYINTYYNVLFCGVETFQEIDKSLDDYCDNDDVDVELFSIICMSSYEASYS